MAELLTIKEASVWATSYLKKTVLPSNISYLIQYGRIKKYSTNGTARVDKRDLMKYYGAQKNSREVNWKKQLGEDLNWHLSFDHLREADTTKHVHRLHPYKGKFIPQLVEYFLDNHTDEFKKESYFKKGDIVLDPFCGSGTTLLQANELGLHAVGIDVSAFNALISNAKLGMYDIANLSAEINTITHALRNFLSEHRTVAFEKELAEELASFNNIHFPVPEYKYRLKNGAIEEDRYAQTRAKTFLKTYQRLVQKHQIEVQQDSSETFLDIWYIKHVRDEISFVFSLLKKIRNPNTKRLLTIILSRTIRSCRATTHSDLATLIKPVTTTYYCSKHGKICKPLFSILGWWERYSADTLKRVVEFTKLRIPSEQYCLTGDSKTIDIIAELARTKPAFARLLKQKRIAGIFSSPPYVGLINYHEQHAYAYDLFGFKRHEHLEIGPLTKGQGREARESYIEGVSAVLKHCKQYLAKGFNIFLVANDKYNLYPTIAERTELRIVHQYKRPVLNRTEKDKGAYSETIFHLKFRNRLSKKNKQIAVDKIISY